MALEDIDLADFLKLPAGPAGACYDYAMSRNVLIRFVPPAPVKIKKGKDTVHVRTWNIDKLVDFLQEGLEMAVAEQLPELDLELQILVSTQPEIRFNGWKPESAGELRTTIGEMIGAVMENIEVDEYLSE